MKTQPMSRHGYHRTNLSSMTRIAAFVALIVFVGLMVFPVFSSSMVSSSSTMVRGENPSATADPSSPRIVERVSKLESMWAVAGSAALARTKSWFSASPSMALASETVEVLAADCTTPKTVFSRGETVCAKTNGVDLSVPGNYYMNWVDSQTNQTNGGVITQNPQYFLYVPPTADTYKATIGRVAPPDSSIVSNPPTFVVTESPGISTLTPDCMTPKTVFTLGETVCATAVGTGGAATRRRVVFIDPSGNARQVSAITADPQSFSFNIPLDQTTDVGGQTVDNRGKWKVNIISSRSSVVATTTFVVKDPANPVADVSVVKFAESQAVSAGSSGTFFISVYNNGPDTAQTVALTDPLPNNTTFTAIVQVSGPTFNCTTPAAGAAGTVTCTIASLPRDTNAQFELAYGVDAGTPAGTEIVNTATVSTTTTDPNRDNNSSSATVTVSSAGGGGTNTCTVACPDDIRTPANTTQDPSDPNSAPGAVVHYSSPSGNTECGAVTTNHCNDCFFPVGITTVTGTATTGESCSFTVTVTPPGGNAPTISCPASQSANADSNCSATLNVGTATATGGTYVTITANRSDGEPMFTCDDFGNCTRITPDRPFTYGVTTITWIASSHDIPGPYDAQTGIEEDHQTGTTTCTQTITVNDVTPPTIAATNQSASADANCQAPVPDYSNTVSDNCSTSISYTQTPAAGTLVGAGSHNVHIEANDNSSNNNGAGNAATKDVTFTVNDTTAPTIQCPDNISVPNIPGTCTASVSPGVATATDNCDGTVVPVPSRSDNKPITDPFPVGNTTITWTATDSAGNSSSCDQHVIVTDNEAPTITCPSNITTNTDPGTCSASVNPGTATATDNCGTGSPTVTGTRSDNQPLNAPYPKGTTTIHWTATDSSGNSSSCDQTVTVADHENPAITCPANITRGTDPGTCSAGVNPGTATATDNCDTATVAGTRSDGQALTAPYPKGTTTITWTATDSSGNQSSCTQTVTVNDTEAPTISCPSNITVNDEPGTCAAHVNPGTATASDNCGSATVTGTRSDGHPLTDPYPDGTTTITWTATDPAGNHSSCTQTITVRDDDPPTMTKNNLTIFFNNLTVVFNTNTVTFNGTTYPFNGVSCTHEGYTFSFNGQTISITNNGHTFSYTFSGNTLVLWTPTHQYQTVNVADLIASAHDDCDPNVDRNDVDVSQVTSDEADDIPGGGDGTTIHDIVIAPGCKSVQLRAERDGNGNGRVYTITTRVRDASGNTTTTTSKLKIYANSLNVVDDGPHNTVNGCP